MITIRRLTIADANALHTLRLAALLESPSAFASSYEEECIFTQTAKDARLVAHPDQGAFGAFSDGVLIGLVAVGRERKRKLAHKASIWGMYIAPNYRGQGLGQRLMEAALALIRDMPGVRQVNLSVTAGNTPAIRLYQTLGFLAYGHEIDAMLVDGELHDEIYMRLSL